MCIIVHLTITISACKDKHFFLIELPCELYFLQKQCFFLKMGHFSTTFSSISFVDGPKVESKGNPNTKKRSPRGLPLLLYSITVTFPNLQERQLLSNQQ
jgi:hypothetical protein